MSKSQFVDGSGMLRALGVGAKLKVKDTATMMIICSDNIATNMIIDYLGLDTINACIRELGFAHTVLHNPLHFDRYRRLGTTTPRDYAALFARIAKGACQPGSQRGDACHSAPAALQHHADPRFSPVLSGLRGDRRAGADLGSQQERQHERLPQRRRHRPHPYGEYVIVLMNKDFHDIIEYNEHPAMVYGARVSRMILDQVLACEGRLSLS